MGSPKTLAVFGAKCSVGAVFLFCIRSASHSLLLQSASILLRFFERNGINSSKKEDESIVLFVLH